MTKFLVYAPRYDSSSGGAIALHKLASILREQGQDAKLWYFDQPHIKSFANGRFLLSFLRAMAKKLVLRRDMKSPYDTPTAKHSDIPNSIVVYPEIIGGNPLSAEHVVRWFLNKPGEMTGKINYGKNELYFSYKTFFNDPTINPHPQNILTVSEIQKDIYRNRNLPNRSGSCYLVRKGKGRPLDYHETGAICIDGMRHQKVADIFNRTQYFISYDPYSMYSRFAAMCGCIPVIVPEEGVTKEAWRPNEADRHGIAYGYEDTEWAIRTRPLLLDQLDSIEKASQESVREFRKKAERFFSLKN